MTHHHTEGALKTVSPGVADSSLDLPMVNYRGNNTGERHPERNVEAARVRHRLPVTGRNIFKILL